MPPRRRYRCRWCGTALNAYLPWAKGPNTVLLLGHVSQQHMDVMSPYLRRMETECIDTVVLELFVLVEGEG